LNIRFNIIVPSKTRSSKWSPCLGSPHQNPVCTSPVRLTWHMPRTSHCSWFDHRMILVRSTQHKAPCYLVFSTPLSPSPS
jgi:hypothetical protein